LDLNNANNTYTGDTVIEGGALRVGGIPTKNTATGQDGSNIVIHGGVLALDGGTFTRAIGTGGDQIRWTGSGGFAAFGADRTVKLGNSTDVITWGAPNFIAKDKELRFGHYMANGTVIWDKKFSFGTNYTTSRNIYLERGATTNNADRATVVFNQELTGTAHLNIRGNGRMDITEGSSDYLALESLNIYGAELRLRDNAVFAYVDNTSLNNGGTLYLKNTLTHTITDRLGEYDGDGKHLTFNAGNLIFDSAFLGAGHYYERFGNVYLNQGANTVGGSSRDTSVFAVGKSLQRDSTSRSTLIFERAEGDTNNYMFLFYEDPTASVGLIGDIYPWAVMNSDAFITSKEGSFSDSGASYSLQPQETLNTGPQNTWTPNFNVRTASGGTLTLSQNRAINSLVLNQNLNLNGNHLFIRSGGLLLGDTPITISSATDSRLALFSVGIARNNPLYIHNANTLTFTGRARIDWSRDVIKTRPGSLILNSNAQHGMQSLYIHQGMVELKNGTIHFSGNNPRIYIGDGAGTDILQLRGNVRNQLVTNNPNIFPSITLHGNPYDPRGPEYGADQAILRLGGNTKQQLKNLHIQDRGTIDWVGGEVGQANILYLDTLTFSGPDAILFMKNWYEYEDYLLVRSNGFNTDYLQNVRFEGYENYLVQWRKYDANYHQITPFGTLNPQNGDTNPEPATTGAILGAVGIGLFTWRKKTRKNRRDALTTSVRQNGSGH